MKRRVSAAERYHSSLHTWSQCRDCCLQNNAALSMQAALVHATLVHAALVYAALVHALLVHGELMPIRQVIKS